MSDEIVLKLKSLAGTAPEDVPAESKFLLEINFSNLTKSHIESQKYWILAVNAALTAQQQQLALEAHAKRIRGKVNWKLPGRNKLGIVAVEQQVRLDSHHSIPRQEEHTQYCATNQPMLAGFFAKQPHPATIMNLLKSNKCLRKPD